MSKYSIRRLTLWAIVAALHLSTSLAEEHGKSIEQSSDLSHPVQTVDSNLSSNVLANILPVEEENTLLTNLSVATTLDGSSTLEGQALTCGVGRPCADGSCCSRNGRCGWGPVYCRFGCTSNCNATTECGQFANPKGKACPLDTCCSEFGFCGTSKDYCNRRCQSNCELLPVARKTEAEFRSKVIGVYDVQSANSPCHQRTVKDLPLQRLTHLNVAYGSVNPSTLDIVSKDSSDLIYDAATEAKSLKPDLNVWLAISGPNFTTTGTNKQSLFSQIARNADTRDRFSRNLAKFLVTYGYDGVDIAWEYPAVPEYGGKDDDVANFVLLLRAVRKAFGSSGYRLGLSITAPTLYEQLRGFDLRALPKEVDWINVKSYDMHGEWDRRNSVGNVIQAHTNLTDIKRALEFFWRNDISPRSIVLGYTFHGRTYQLQNSTCARPGCRFEGEAWEGPCSERSGILAHHEINALRQQNPSIKPIWDKTAAVKYFAYADGSQWVSYDDSDTFKQKQAFQEESGLGGSMIWRIDDDDDRYSAMSGLIGEQLGVIRTLKPVTDFTMTPMRVASYFRSSIGEECTIEVNRGCVSESKTPDCGEGKVGVGVAFGTAVPTKKKCGKQNEGYPICCPIKEAPRDCEWRGGTNGARDCNGQCHAGEVRVRLGDGNGLNSWGGFPREPGTDLKQCGRGGKAFCCKAEMFDDAVKDCNWRNECQPGETSLAKEKQGDLEFDFSVKNYCCKDPSQIHDCRWDIGGLDCVNANCRPDEVVIHLSRRGSERSCLTMGRHRPLCCKVHVPEPKPGATCAHACDTEPELCENHGLPPDIESGIPEDSESGLVPRELALFSPLGEQRSSSFSKSLRALIGRSKQKLRNYFSRGTYFSSGRTGPAQGLFHAPEVPLPAPNVGGIPGIVDSCMDTRLVYTPMNNQNEITPQIIARHRPETEHPIDATILINDFFETLLTGQLRSGNFSKYGKLDSAYIRDVLLAKDGLPAKFDNIPVQVPKRNKDAEGYRPFYSRTAIDRLTEGLGSSTNPYPFTLLEGAANGIKGRLASNKNPRAMDRVHRSLTRAVDNQNQNEFESVISVVQETHLSFVYQNDPITRERFVAVHFTMDAELELVGNETNPPGGRNLHLRWDEFLTDIRLQMSSSARSWGREVLERIRNVAARINIPAWPRDRIERVRKHWLDQTILWNMPQPPTRPIP